MSDSAIKYRAEMLRAAFGPRWSELKADDLHRLTQYAERLAEAERSQEILRAKGYGYGGQSLIEIASSVPENVRGILRNLFRRDASH